MVASLAALATQQIAAAWLKSRADDFFRRGDTAAAINAYSDAIKADAHQAPLYLNRAVCYFGRKDFVKCVEDCDTALRLLQDPANAQLPLPTADGNSQPPQAQALRIKALLRRAAAHHALGNFAAASIDCSSASASAPSDEDAAATHELVERMEAFKTGLELKQQADAACKEGRVLDSLPLYDAAAEAAPAYVLPRLNRAAAAVSCGKLEECVADCTTALDILNEAAASGLQAAAMTYYPLPGTELHAHCMSRALVRRGVALSQLGRAAEALADYKAVAHVPMVDVALLRDVAALRQIVQPSGSTPAATADSNGSSTSGSSSHPN